MSILDIDSSKFEELKHKDFSIPDLIGSPVINNFYKVDSLPEVGEEGSVYMVDIDTPEPTTKRAREIYEIAKNIVNGGFDMYMYTDNDYIQLTDFWAEADLALQSIYDPYHLYDKGSDIETVKNTLFEKLEMIENHD